MWSFRYRLYLSSFNFFGVFCFTFDNDKLKILHLHEWLNLLKLPIVLILSVLLTSITSWQDEVLNYDIIHLEKYSIFSKKLILVAIYFEQISAFWLCAVNYYYRREILNFVNKTLSNALSDAFREKFRKICNREILFFAILTSSLTFVQFLTSTNFKPASLLAHVIILYPYCAFMAFKCLLKTYEWFFVIMLQDFRNDLEQCEDAIAYQSLLTKYQKISSLNQDFNNVFGLQTTIASFSDVVLFVFQVK